MKKVFYSIMLVSLALMPMLATAQGAMHPKTDKHGFYNITDCPTSLSFIKATSQQQEEGTYNVSIYRGRELAQTFSLEVTSGDLYYLDANFDGNMDILAGPAASRNCSTILLWDDGKGEFVQMEGDMYMLNGDFLVNPGKKFLVGAGSGSYCSQYYTRYVWKGNRLVATESLIEITDPNAYKEYGVNRRYTVIKGNNYDKIAANKKVATNKKSQLPAEWRTILASYGM